jgi:hypothetical protein
MIQNIECHLIKLLAMEQWKMITLAFTNGKGEGHDVMK